MTFPEDVRWGSGSSRLRRPLIAFGSSRAGSRLVKALTPVDRRLLVRSRGRFTVLGPLGLPTMLLTVTGATSGLPRTTPLLYARDGASLIVVGSNFGGATHPLWTKNLIANPSCTVTIGGVDAPAVATLLVGAEAEAGYQRMVEVVPTYDVYRTRTDRDIRVFRLAAQETG